MRKNFICSLIGQAGILLALGVLSGADAHARHLQPEEALSFLGTGQLKSPSTAPLRLAYTQEADDQPAVYVFNREGAPGFYVLAADDAVGDIILGYSDDSHFSAGNMSPGMKWLLEAYAARVNVCDGTVIPRSRVSDERTAIEPLISTKWDQDSPFSDYCPTLSGKHCPTGCVATAMAQVLNYYEYPTKGMGSYSYNWNGTMLSFNYGNTTFDWENMLNVYSAGATQVQKEAVAKLMYACGVSVEMDYDRNGSGATEARIPYALKSFFNYDKGVRFLKRSFYNSDEWEELIYGELAEGRPVIYGGKAYDGGHQFVCDGYLNGKFHINWGWGGYGDAYFRLNDLDPQVSGTGGASGGYNSDQSVIIGIRPASNVSTPWYPLYANTGFSVGVDSGSTVKVSFSKGGVFNYSPEPVKVQFLFKAVSETGAVYYSKEGRDYDFDGMDGTAMSGYGAFSAMSLPTGLASGTYKVYLEFKTPEGNIQPVMIPVTCVSYFVVKVADNGKVTISDGEPEAKASILVSDFTPHSIVRRGEASRFDVTIQNIGDIDYTGSITAKLYRYGEGVVLAEYGIGGLSVAAATSFDGYVNLTIDYPDGKYSFRVFDMYGKQVSDTFDFWVGEPQDGIESVLKDFERADVYTTAGILLRKNADREYVNNLERGIYIVVVSGKSYKILR